MDLYYQDDTSGRQECRREYQPHLQLSSPCLPNTPLLSTSSSIVVCRCGTNNMDLYYQKCCRKPHPPVNPKPTHPQT